MAFSTIASLAGSAISTITELAGSSVVGELISTGFSYLRDHILPADSEAELKRLRVALPQIKAVVGIAEALKMKDPNTREWVEQFRQAVEASEDVLDELEYKKLEDMVTNQDEAGGSASSSKKRRPCIINDDTLERLKEAVTMLDRAAAETKHLLQHAKRLGIHAETDFSHSKVLSPETISFLAEKILFGRQVEKYKIIGWLKRSTHARLSSFGIVGMGGVGKTTLVQFACQEIRRLNHFDKIIWVCVSTNFSVEDITRKMLGELGEISCSGKPLKTLQMILKEKIHLKKILLILDDIWDDEKRSDWEQLVSPLRFVQQGSKILFTTRMRSVGDLLASVMSTDHESLVLQGLGEQELRLLFYSYAFRGCNPDNYRDLQIFGAQILKMLRGSPLAAKVIGSLLNSQLDRHHWGRVLNSGSIFNLELAKDVVEVLKLSYYHLPANLQVCFRFCSIFPQDHKFDKNDLIKMWIACGFIRQQFNHDERPEDIGEDYFNILLRKSFFEYSKSLKGESYVMNDLVHELAQNVSYGECCRIELNDRSITIPTTIRHVSVHESEIEKVSHLMNLRSLVITTSMEETKTDPDLFVLSNILNNKTLRLLKINGYRTFELPEAISCLVHLRYLSIGLNFVSQQFKFSNLASIYKLYHLQVVEFSTTGDSSTSLGIETTGITNLLRLRYMRLPKKMMQAIRGVHKLMSLQELTFFIGKDSGSLINELATLKNLRHLSIKQIENIDDPVEAKSANLLGKNNLLSLSLIWTLESNPDNHEQIIDYLQPPPNLKELTVENYKGQRSPRWMKESGPSNLSSLKFFSCPVWKNQLFSWHMPFLKTIYIYNCASLEKLPDMPLSLIEFRIHNVGLTSLPNLYSSFDNNTLAPLSLKSSLRVVQIERCPNLILLDGFMKQGHLDLEDFVELVIKDCEKLVHLPTHGFGFLKSLNITNCPNLTKLPSLRPTSLTTFLINNVAVSALPEYYQLSVSSDDLSTSYLEPLLREVRISNCQKLTSLNGFLVQDNMDFQSNIEKIEVSNCKNLVNLPVGAFGKFVSLKELTIRDCPMLAAIDNHSNLLPVKLKYLVIEICGELDVPLLESASHLTTLTDLWINNCANISRIPSSEKAFGSLNELRIYGCKKLVEHSSREQAYGANQGSSLASLKISRLEIDHLSLLLIEPLRSLRSVSYLRVWYCSGMEALPEQWFLQNSNTLCWLSIRNASTLKSLPATMARLTALEWIEIWKANLLQELPVLPTNLRSLVIREASSLQSLPDTMARLTALEWLEIVDADLLEKLPELPASLKQKYIGRRGATSPFRTFSRSYLSSS